MVFSSLLFLFYFFPLAFLVYYLTPNRWKNATLLLASIVFYCWGDPTHLPLMLLLVLANFGLGHWIHHGRKKGGGKLALGVALTLTIGLLVFFKYTGFLVNTFTGLTGLTLPFPKLAQPLGISFFTFHILSYSIDIYRGTIAPEKNLINYSTAVLMFPQFTAGPITRYSQLKPQLTGRTVSLSTIQSGVFSFIMGLGSKVLLADNLSALWTETADIGYTAISTPMAWLGLLGFALQIYFDFSGYSLMAIGLGKMLGFELPTNFNYPFTSKSITEFWRRWHMTLGAWFRDYIYIPLGGNRVSFPRQILNILAVWALTGLWHGASWNFVLWGLFFFAFLILEKQFLLKHLERSKVWSHIYLLLLITISWALFAIEDFSALGQYFTALFSGRGGWEWLYYLRNYAVVLILGILFSLPIIPTLQKKLGKAAPVVGTLFAGLVLFASLAYLVDSTYNPFLYFRF